MEIESIFPDKNVFIKYIINKYFDLLNDLESKQKDKDTLDYIRTLIKR